MKKLQSLLAVLLAASCTLPQTALAQTTPGPDTLNKKNTPATVRSMRAARATTTIKLDGNLDDPAWATVKAESDFTQSYPKAGQPGTERTEVRVLYDDAALYIGVRAFDSRADSIAAQLARRDATGIYSDWIHVVVDSYHDRRNGFRFSTNPRGVQKDVLHSDDRSEDLNWDAVWEVATSVDKEGWTAEYRIPFSQLRFGGAGKGQERVWGIQVQRDIARRGERVSWNPWKPADPGFISMAGDLTGITDIPIPRRLEVLPYVSNRLTRAPGDPANPFYRQNDTRSSIGGDVKFGLPNGLTLTATVNPDFGQVEVDPAVVNLSAFESFFPEKRPFFVEGASIFNLGSVRTGPGFGNQQIFYSRRIGRSPQRFAQGQFVNAPEATTILGAAKLSGKTGPWTVGLLDAVTAEENAEVDNGNGVRTTTPVEPFTNYLIGRVRRDLRGGQTLVGIGGTSVVRRVDDAVFKDLLRSNASVISADFEHRFPNKQWLLTGAFNRSAIAGTERVITSAQRSSARYYQRPDADYLELDPNATGLNGHSEVLGLTKSGDLRLGFTAKQVSPGFEVNDLGFMGRVDYRNLGMSAFLNNNTPGKLLRDYNFGGGMNHAWNFGGDRIWTSFFGESNMTFTNQWYTGFGAQLDPPHLDDRMTRGGPLGKQPLNYGMYNYGGSDSKRRIPVYWNLNYYGDTDGGYYRSIYPGFDVRPTSTVKLSISPGFEQGLNTLQFVRSVGDVNATSTYARRYVFADLRQTTLSANIRAEWTLSRALSFQSYLQPFASSGAYTRFKELETPATTDYTYFGEAGTTITSVTGGGKVQSYAVDPDGAGAAPSFSISNPDFRTQSLRGNAVMRWEYRPGSALFFVWQQERSAFTPLEGDFRLGRDTRDIFGRPSNTFLVKATYWFAR
ncbi:MAG: carbohydrate binding family 9 domain-containing protein [Gemmatimonadaceae bacterium]|nr:carbohydrate binding family 9 domain-containing protein [Gemmatimonadaceae bacterium]